MGCLKLGLYREWSVVRFFRVVVIVFKEREWVEDVVFFGGK